MNEGQRQAAAQYASICRMLADLDAAEDIDDEEDANPARWRFLPVQPSDCSPFGL